MFEKMQEGEKSMIAPGHTFGHATENKFLEITDAPYLVVRSLMPWNLQLVLDNSKIITRQSIVKKISRLRYAS